MIVLIIVGIVFYFKNNYHQVTVYINEVDKVKIYQVRHGEKLEKLKNPSMEGYAFAGWYYFNTEDEFDENEKITKDITIMAKWAKVNFK